MIGDAVLRRMLATPKPGKGGKTECEARTDKAARPTKARKGRNMQA